ncbi:MAG TPA: TonB family protein, partial [Gemmatimonadaceae bacterium]|nr:TonB family protein [Gemmatimonadaceae bacterium]
YPRALRNAGVEAEVVITFVVDATGGVERGSVTVVSATHELFADAVRRWLPHTRYAPAEINGKKVRQLVQQQLGFTLR